MPERRYEAQNNKNIMIPNQERVNCALDCQQYITEYAKNGLV